MGPEQEIREDDPPTGGRPRQQERHGQGEEPAIN